MSHLLHLEGKLFKCCGSLFLVCLDDFGSSEFTINEMMIGCSVWTVRYRVHTDDFMTPLPEDERMEITGSTKLHKHMRFWFVQEITKEEGLLKFLRDRYDDLRRKNARCRVLIREMEALGERGVAVDSLESMK
nr:hypothetical protein [Tanacetum cinerariifolium]